MKFAKSLLSVLCLSTLGLYSGASNAESTSSWEIAKYPLYVGSAALPPLVMILMGRDHSMFYEAYNDMTDLDDDGKIDFIFNPAVVYDGLFESNYCYNYSNNVFEIASVANSESVTFHGKKSVVYTCSGQFSGNFLNYLTASRLDLVKRILIGGQRLVTEGVGVSKTARANGYPYLTRQWIPHDTHVWAKIFNPVDYTIDGGKNCPLASGCTIDKWTPYGSNEAYLFGNVQRHMLSIKFECSGSGTDKTCSNNGFKLGSMEILAQKKDSGSQDSYLTQNIFLWNWLARESGVGGGVGEMSISGATVTTRITNPDGQNYSTYTANKYNVVVESCNPTKVGVDNLSSRCKKYTNYYNTVGLLQQFSENASVDAYFGLITAGWNRNGTTGQSYGVLRAPVSNLFNQIDQSTGEFANASVLSVINNIDLKTENASLSGGSTSTNWNGCGIDADHTKRVYQRGCADWGNPLAPLITLSHDYFEGKFASSKGKTSTGSESIRVRSSWDGDAPAKDLKQTDYGYNTNKVYLPGINSDVQSPFKNDGIYECQKAVNLILLDENVSLDWYGGDSTSITAGFDIIDQAEHFVGGSYVFGEKKDNDSDAKIKDFDTIPSLKTIDSLNNVRGISVLEPQQSGSMKGAAAAAYYYTKPLDLGDGKEYSSIQNVVVAMASYLPKFEIFAKNGKSVLFIPTCKTPRLVSKTYYYTGQWSGNGLTARDMWLDDGNSYTTTCGIGDVFYMSSEYNDEGKLSGIEFRVTYEDNDGGSDFDMDVAGSYKISQNAADDNVLDVEIKGYYSDGYAPMTLGYVIVGTNGIYEYDHTTNQYKLNQNKMVYFDVTKGSNNGNKPSLLAIQSDPFYDINNIRADGAIDPNNRVWFGGINQTVHPGAVAAKSNQGGKSNGDARFCYEDSVWYFNDRDFNDSVFWAPMILGSNNNDYSTFVWPVLPRVGAAGGGTPMYCTSSVQRKFRVVGTEGSFLPSALELTAKYGYKNTSLSNYYYVTNAATLAENITAAMKATVSAGDRSSTALTFPSVEISTDNAETIIANFDAAYWTGEVKKVRLSGIDTGAVSTAGQIWSASDNISHMVKESRKIYLAGSDGVLSAFTANNIVSSSNGVRNYPRMYQGIINAFGAGQCTDDEVKTLIDRYVNYVRGDETYELADDLDDYATPALVCGETTVVAGFHKRDGKKLGTVINSTPQVVTIGSKRYVIFSANDGMVHFLDESNGAEVMAVVPYVGQYDMPRAAVRGDVTRYILDGELNVYSVKVGSTQRYIVYGSRGLAFPGVFAMDITDIEKGPEHVRMLWELSKNEKKGVVRAYSQLGTFSSPIAVFPYLIREGDSGKTALYTAFGNGYNSSANDPFSPEGDSLVSADPSANGNSSVVVLNALSGEVKVSLTDAVWGKPDCNREPDVADLYAHFKDSDNGGKCFSNGMNPTLAMYDPDHDIKPEYGYSTDLYGNAYRLTMANKVPSQWQLTRIYTAVYGDLIDGFRVQPITTKPSLAGNLDNQPVVIFGTGKYLTSADVQNTDVQSLYAVEDKNYKSGTTVIPASCATGSITCLRTTDKLYRMKTVQLQSTAEATAHYRDLMHPTDSDGNEVKYDTDLNYGWVIDMTAEPGERMIVDQTVQDRHVYVTTMVPTDNPCAGGGTGHMYDINVVAARFSKSAEESQLFSKQIMSKATTAYSRPTGTRSSTQMDDGTLGEEVRKRAGTATNCTSVHVATQINGGDVTVLSGPQYCPRVESWQYIFH